MLEKILHDRTFRKVLIIFLIAKILVLSVGIISHYFIPEDLTYRKTVTDNIFLNPWAQLDSQAYLDIAKNGYNPEFNNGLGNYGWYPFYPFLISLFSFIGFELAAFLISNIASFLAILALYLLVKEEFGDKIAKKSIFYLLFFPAAYFLTAMYTESLFLLLSISMFYFAKREKWLYVGILGLLLSLTRMQGILLFFPMLYMFYRKNKLKAQVLTIFLIPLGLVILMGYHYSTSGDSLIFLRAQEEYSSRMISFPLLAFADSISKIISYNNFRYFLYNFSNLSITIFLLLLSYIAWKKKYLKNEYLIYLLILIIFPMFSGTLDAMARFAITMFPAFITISMITEKEKKYNTIFKIIYIIFIILLIFSTARYVNEDINLCEMLSIKTFC